MKKMKISTIMLIICLLSMSMGFPHEVVDEKGSKSTSSSGWLMSCSPQQARVKKDKPAIEPQAKSTKSDTNKKCSELTGRLANESAKAIVNLLGKQK